MEKGVFHHSAVAEILEERFVEARIHTDSLDHPGNADLQLEMTQSVAQPIYLVVDPRDGTQHSRRDGATLSDDQPFIDFLNEGWNSAREKHASR
jgi:hypothetical protein